MGNHARHGLVSRNREVNRIEPATISGNKVFIVVHVRRLDVEQLLAVHNLDYRFCSFNIVDVDALFRWANFSFIELIGFFVNKSYHEVALPISNKLVIFGADHLANRYFGIFHFFLVVDKSFQTSVYELLLQPQLILSRSVAICREVTVSAIISAYLCHLKLFCTVR